MRAVSNDPTVVELASHAAWFASRVASGAFWIIEHAGAACGSVRIDGGRISIALASSARNKGLGKHAISAACAAWARPVTAEIREDNQPSRAAFEACGFVVNDNVDDNVNRIVTYQWSP
ncbi:hypothetical protein BH11MYX1_BH11MYX1_34440 [soil metagenome]